MGSCWNRDELYATLLNKRDIIENLNKTKKHCKVKSVQHCVLKGGGITFFWDGRMIKIIYGSVKFFLFCGLGDEKIFRLRRIAVYFFWGGEEGPIFLGKLINNAPSRSTI